MIDLSFLVGCFVLGVIGWFAYKVYIWSYYISPLRKVPGSPSESLLFGNVKIFFVEEVNIYIYIYTVYIFFLKKIPFN